MKKLLFLILTCTIISCATEKKSSSLLNSGDLITTRRYIGNFIDYSYTGPEVIGGVDLIWIKTTLYPRYGKISVYGRNCAFSAGQKLYLKRTGSTPGRYGIWEFQVENDSSACYKVSEYRYENNVLVRANF